jgi:ubiquinone/menaquinone biosynthesis C-methylase UbiE
MPVADDSFDYVVSYQVLEHVHSIEHIFRECLRVLKPGGLMYHVCPNYHSFYEGHYKVIWWPFLSKKSGRLYLKLLHRDPAFFDTLNLARPAIVCRAFEKLGEQFRVISLGKKEFKEKFNQDQINKVDQPVLRILLKSVNKVSPVKRAFLSVLSGIGIYYPLTIIAQKKV